MKESIFKTILAIILGEIALIAFTTIAQEVIYDGISYTESPLKDLIIGGFLTFLAAVITGMIASIIGGKNNHWPPLIISILIIAETTYLISIGISSDPLWFDCFAGLSLILGIWTGYFVKRKFL